MKAYRKKIKNNQNMGAATVPELASSEDKSNSICVEIKLNISPPYKQTIRNLSDIRTRCHIVDDNQGQITFFANRRLVISDCPMPACKRIVWNISCPFRSWRSDYIQGYSPYVLHLLCRNSGSYDFHRMIDGQVFQSRRMMCLGSD